MHDPDDAACLLAGRARALGALLCGRPTEPSAQWDATGQQIAASEAARSKTGRAALILAIVIATAGVGALIWLLLEGMRY